MSITDPGDIHANLLSAQDNQTRKPLIEIISSAKEDDIPFDGNVLATDDNDLLSPSAIVDSTGRVIVLGSGEGTVSDPDHPKIVFIYTDINRIEFTRVDTDYATNHSLVMLSCNSCELSDSTGRFGVIAKCFYNGRFYLQRSVLTSVGVLDVARSDIIDFNDEYLLSNPWVMSLGSNEYLMVYSSTRRIDTAAVWGNIAFESGATSGTGQDEVTDSGNNFVADGFVTGQRLFLGDTTTNDGTYEIATVAVGLITLTSTNRLTTEAAISGTDLYRLDSYIYKDTSSGDFISWAGESELTISGLISTDEIDNPSIIEIDNGDLWLWFDVIEDIGDNDEELKNLYYSVSDDDGATWAAAVKATNLTLYADIASHPIAVQRTTTTMDVIYNRTQSVLHMRQGDGLWTGDDDSYTLSFDSVNRKLYVVNTPTTLKFSGVVEIDIDTWVVTDYWDAVGTSPQFPSYIADEDVGVQNRLSDGHHIAIAHRTAGSRQVWYLDADADTITAYYMDTNLSPSPTWTKNVDTSGLSFADDGDGYVLGLTQVCYNAAGTKRIYCFFGQGLGGNNSYSFGYINLAEAGPAYTLTVLIDNVETLDAEQVYSIYGTNSGMYIDEVGGYFVIVGGGSPTAEGFVILYDLTTGLELKRWDTSNSGFPLWGLTFPFIYNGVIYGGMTSYSSTQSSMRGLVEINIATEAISVHRPTYCTEDNHFLGKSSFMENDPITSNPKIIMTHKNYGVVSFDTVAKTWERWSSDTIPDFGDELWMVGQVTYDSTGGLIMAGDVSDGVFMFSKEGYIKTPYYIDGVDSSGWTFDDANPSQFVQAVNNNYDAVAVVEPSATSIYAFWENDAGANNILKWDKDGSDVDITEYVLAGQDITTTRTIDGNPATLSFQVSDGHLFDPNNVLSLLSPVLKKGRKLTLRWGETVSGSPLWCNAGEFFVTETAIQLGRGEYPIMSVNAGDQRVLWRYSNVFATDIYNNMPNDIIDDILDNFAGIDPIGTNIPAFTNEVLINHQWIDSTLETIISQIDDRFGYFFRFDIDGATNAKPISNTLSIDHIYTATDTLMDFTPDDRYSDFTNEITVQGQEDSFTQVVYPEERITQISGTVGWYGGREDHTVWFSDDQSRRCINPRMDAVETSTGMFGGGVTERLIDEGATYDNKRCTVQISVPSQKGILAAFVLLAFEGFLVGDYAPVVGGLTIPVGSIEQQVGVIGALTVLSSQTNYQIEVYAQPLGQIRRSVQNTWEDTEHQTSLGTVVAQSITDQLCYTAFDCGVVADFEGMVVQMQRNRVAFSKTAHLQDEEGDTITYPHPYGGQSMDIFVTDITRTYRKPMGDGDEGYFRDTIAGWVR